MKSLHRLLTLLLCISAASAAAAADISQRQRKTPDAVRIVSANIRYLAPDDKTTGNDWDKRKELARDVLLAQDADIICFQEFDKAHLDYLIKQFPGYTAFGFVERKEGQRKLNTVFYSKKRFSAISEGGAFLSATPDVYRSKFPESSQVRHVTRVHLKDRVTGREVIVWNAHFDHRSQPARDQQASALIDIAKKYASADIPQIITGDLNCMAKTKALQTLFSGGFIDSYTAIHGPKDPGFTYHGFKGVNHKTASGKIDFVLANKTLRPTVAEIIRDSRDGRYPSDHYFVSTEFEYAK